MTENPKDFSYLGYDFQKKSIAQVISDKVFGNKAVPAIQTSYYDDKQLKFIFQCIKEHFQNYETIPTLDTLEIILRNEIREEKNLKIILDVLNEIKLEDLKDSKPIQDIIERFCTQQALKTANKEIQKIIDKSDPSEFHKCEEIVRKALNLFTRDDNEENIFDNIEETLAEDNRETIPTGIKGLDEELNGGVGKGEVLLGIAPLGTGKTTLGVKIANTGASMGKNVVHIFFEDKMIQIRQKHFSCWSGIPINDLTKNKEKVLEIIEEYKEIVGNNLKLKKFSTVGTKFIHIRNHIKKLVLDGFIPDMIVLDYIDCIEPDVLQKDNDYSGEGLIMRNLEALAEDFNCATISFIQSNRAGINKEIVSSQDGGGSIKKQQFGHIIISLGRTLIQMELNRATLAILKSRVGGSGKVFENILFDNSRVIIDTDDTTEEMSFVQHSGKKKEEKDGKIRKRIAEILNDK